jgi:hypothetical protein
MHGLNIRPNGKPEAEPYNPNRDIAFCAPSILKAAIWGLRKANWEPWVTPYLEYSHCTEAALADAVVKFAYALRAMRVDHRVTSPKEALELSGFLATPAAAQFVIMAKVGQVMTGAFFNAIRDVTYIGDGSRKDIEQMVEEAEQTANLLRRS